TSMTCSPTDGRVYLGTYDDLWVTVVDSTDTVAAVIPTSRGTPDMVLFSALRNELYSALNDDYAAIIDGAGDTVKAYLDYVFYQIRNPIHNPAGNKLYLLMNDEDIVRVMGPDNRVVKDIPVGLVDTRPYPVLNPILNRLYIADRDVFWVVDCNTDSLLRSVPMGTVDDPVALLHQDLNRVFVFPRRDASAVFVYDCLRDSFVATIEVGNNTPCAAYQPTVNRFYCGVYSSTVPTVAVIDPVACTVAARFSAGRRSRGMRVLANPVNGLVYVANDGENRLYIFDARADTLLRAETLAVDADTMFWNRTFNKAYLCHLNSTLVLDCNTNTFTGSIAAGVNEAGLMNDRNDKLYLGSLLGVNVVDCRTDSVIASLGGVTVPYNFAWSVVDNRVFTSARGNELAVYRDDLVAVESGDIPAHVSLQLGANPVRGRALLRARVPPGHTAELSVVDVSGRVILRQALSVERQASSVVLDLRSMPPGVYFARLEAGTQRSTGKFVLQR
ncbi:T9SS type A sorting domain-containing protein, partial [candidate division WOR-3 bacterium]|nr:T9SS type A sorting domain-containing protein [candidate division WOR-3 bacterium]